MSNISTKGACTLVVKNLSWMTDKRELFKYFSKFGPIKSSVVVYNQESGLSRRFGFVHFYERSSAKAAKGTHNLDSKAITADITAIH